MILNNLTLTNIHTKIPFFIIKDTLYKVQDTKYWFLHLGMHMELKLALNKNNQIASTPSIKEPKKVWTISKILIQKPSETAWQNWGMQQVTH